MTSVEIDCMKCAHFLPEIKTITACLAFPLGIPDAIVWGEQSHRKPIEGDHGIQFKEAKA
jgi:hypothetical protein